MPLLDVDDAIDVTFLDRFQLVTSQMVIDNSGMPTITTIPAIWCWGVVVPVPAAQLRRLGDGSRLQAGIDVYTRHPLTIGFKTDDVASQTADIVVWHGRAWTVAAIDDYSAFGRGYLHAQCDLSIINPLTREPQTQ